MQIAIITFTNTCRLLGGVYIRTLITRIAELLPGVFCITPRKGIPSRQDVAETTGSWRFRDESCGHQSVNTFRDRVPR